MNSETSPRWAERLRPGMRITLIVVAFILGVFAIGMVAGLSHAMIEDGELPTKPAVYLILAAMIGLVALIGWFLMGLYRSTHPERLSRFDRRYWQMWGILAALGIPFGIGVGVLGLREDADFFSMVLSNEPVAPLTAILGSILLCAVVAVSMLIYFRAIDDHEERAYLWGSNVAFHFLALAFPLYWLLARGSLVPALTIGSALLIVLLSCIVQAVVWALFKFR